MIWLWFALIQFVQLVATVVGWIVLIPFCLLQAWSANAFSIKDGRRIDSWTWSLLNSVYGNPEDGVSGKQAVVWLNGTASPYYSNWSPIIRAYYWSALRNSCDNLKYIFANKKGPLITWTWTFSIPFTKYSWTRTSKMGWQEENGFNVPVLSL